MMMLKGNPHKELHFSLITYARGEALQKLLHSVAEQQYAFVEVIVPDKVRYQRLYENLSIKTIGTYAAGHYLNLAVRHAKGDIIGFLHEEETLMPYALHRIASQMRKGSAGCIIAKSKSAQNREEHQTFFHIDHLALSVARAQLSPAECFLRKEIIEWIGGIDERLNHWTLEELWVRLLCATEGKAIVRLPELVAQTQHTGKLSEAARIERDTFFFTLANMFRFYHAAYFIRDFGKVAPDFLLPHYRNLESNFVYNILKQFCSLLLSELPSANQQAAKRLKSM